MKKLCLTLIIAACLQCANAQEQELVYNNPDSHHRFSVFWYPGWTFILMGGLVGYLSGETEVRITEHVSAAAEFRWFLGELYTGAGTRIYSRSGLRGAFGGVYYDTITRGNRFSNPGKLLVSTAYAGYRFEGKAGYIEISSGVTYIRQTADEWNPIAALSKNNFFPILSVGYGVLF